MFLLEFRARRITFCREQLIDPVVQLAEQIASSERILETQLREEEAARAGNDAKREAYERISDEVASLDEGVREFRSEISNRRDQVNAAELRSRELELTLAHLEESIRDKWDVEIASWSPPSVESEEPATAPLESAAEATGGDRLRRRVRLTAAQRG